MEYDLGEERSYVWLVTRDSITAYELPKRAEIEAAARKLREVLTARNGVGKDETDVERLRHAKKADAEYPATAVKVSRMLLGAVTFRIEHKRLLVVSDGILQYISFVALPVPSDTAGGGFAASPPLMSDHEIVNLPSSVPPPCGSS